ncbi:MULTISPECIES: hypothetical protein [unclassified Mesorhizobium]|uniref:hypothetical protein n=1 Tax=unclassified Mesorhizobium TaxID=325217 RepID=UPI003335C7BF
MKPRQLDLFAWAENRPTAKIISIFPKLAAKLWVEINAGHFENPIIKSPAGGNVESLRRHGNGGANR